MALNFRIKKILDTKLKISHKDLLDVNDLLLDKSKYMTAEQLAAEFKLNKEAVLFLLNYSNVIPIAKITNSNLYPNGKPVGGRPKLVFDPEIARKAITEAIEEKYK